VDRVCFYHAGCPDGFGAAWAVWTAWRRDGIDGRFVARGHDDPLEAESFEGAQVVFVDIAPDNAALARLMGSALQVVVLDHHLSSLDRYRTEPELELEAERGGHQIHFDLTHSGAVLAWNAFGGGAEVPDLLAYVEDQDLWNWKLPRSEEVNAAIASYPRTFEAWTALAQRAASELADEGAPIVRSNRVEVERVLATAHPVAVGGTRVEAVNATQSRSTIGHELAKRAAFGRPWGCVYRVVGRRVDASLYSIGELDVSKVAQRFGGGGHRNAAGFSVPLERWVAEFA
jgi:oligoribonuclease NrnB/cAMP/cGMP phosphodiesterase (DHH superfamily)